MPHFGYRVYAEACGGRAAAAARVGRFAPKAEPSAQDILKAATTTRRPRAELRALDILGASEHWTKSQIQARYRALVKRFHPDLNGGCRANEGRFRDVLWAWDRIKDSPAFLD